MLSPAILADKPPPQSWISWADSRTRSPPTPVLTGTTESGLDLNANPPSLQATTWGDSRTRFLPTRVLTGTTESGIELIADYSSPNPPRSLYFPRDPPDLILGRMSLTRRRRMDYLRYLPLPSTRNKSPRSPTLAFPTLGCRMTTLIWTICTWNILPAWSNRALAPSVGFFNRCSKAIFRRRSFRIRSFCTPF
jgi:hypothetical protein